MRRRRPLTPAQQALAADPRHRGLALYLARRQARGQRWLADDLRGAALLGLVEAAGRWDPQRGVPFLRFAARRIEGALRDCCRTWAPKGYRRRADAPRREPLPEAPLPAPDRLPVGWELESVDAVEALTRGLPWRPRLLVRRRYTEAGMTVRRLGMALGCTANWVSVQINAGLRRLRKEF